MKHAILILFALIALPLCTLAAKPKSDSGLPVPRFVSLKSSEVNVRSGPGTRYPIAWVYRREGLPVEVVEEFEHWRKIRDADGGGGWVHKGMLAGDRTVQILGSMRTLYKEPDEHSKPALKVEKGVIGKLLECGEVWCRVQIAGRKAWVEKKSIYGIYLPELYKR